MWPGRTLASFGSVFTGEVLGIGIFQDHKNGHEAPVSEGSSRVSRSRIVFERWFGDEENPMHFVGRLDGLDAGWTRFYVKIPFY